ncbi:hypothetical protein T4A_14317 [Trichinella pseudospiralis]|uniref:Uncharacterized protein n=1 Tax=Trichinella pseudospiralis TaxID=6337 RepID=A0A0V1DUR3_TRIPS|nr:hypothetical protein T4A_6790 [Trichinella pseudospiralis]KRY75440.1 hypothetical protein T4A_14317 [Trichinella pseudospiralis]
MEMARGHSQGAQLYCKSNFNTGAPCWRLMQILAGQACLPLLCSPCLMSNEIYLNADVLLSLFTVGI